MKSTCLLSLVFGGVLLGCSSSPAKSSDPWVNSEMQALVANKCAVSGCHNGSEDPDLDGIAESAMKAETEALREVEAGRMPKRGSLTAEEKALFIDFYKN